MIKNKIFKYLPRHRNSRLLRRLDQICVRYHQAFENLDYDFSQNGENFVLATLSRHTELKTIFDVGANTGEWAALAASIAPDARIYSFEIVPETFRQLKKNTIGFGNVSAFGLGLSDTPGKIPVFYSPNRNANATCVEGVTELFHKHNPDAVEAEVTTGDSFCIKHGIDEIDFLKMDVEGFEPRVLRGLENLLQAGRVKVIQFEYGYVNIVVKFLLKDYYDLLERYNMQIGKIFPNYVDFKDYELQDEDFFGPNYLAVHSSCSDLIRTLQDPYRP